MSGKGGKGRAQRSQFGGKEPRKAPLSTAPAASAPVASSSVAARAGVPLPPVRLSKQFATRLAGGTRMGGAARVWLAGAVSHLISDILDLAADALWKANVSRSGEYKGQVKANPVASIHNSHIAIAIDADAGLRLAYPEVVVASVAFSTKAGAREFGDRIVTYEQLLASLLKKKGRERELANLNGSRRPRPAGGKR